MNRKNKQSGAAEMTSKGSPMLYLLIGLLIVALAGGAYYYNNMAGYGVEGEPPPSERTVRMRQNEPPVFVKLEPFTVRLMADAREGRESYVQVQPDIHAVDVKAGERIKQYTPAIRYRFLLLLSSKRSAELSSAEGIQKLSNEMRVEANAIVDGPLPKSSVPSVAAGNGSNFDSVQSVVFSTFVLQ